MFIDTHCHIYKEYYDDINSVINESIKNGITRFINNGCDNTSNREIIKMIDNYSEMYGAIGIHPENVDNYNGEDIENIKSNILKEKIVAIGEIGLDYHYSKENKYEQIRLFETQLQIAQDYNIPVIIHSRDATEDTISTLKKYKLKGVIHSFSGSLESANEYIKMGFVLGINGVVTFKNCNLKEILKNISLKNIVLETDSPYLTPEPNRGKKNKPGNIIFIAKFLTDLYNISLEELAKITNENVKRVFDI